MYTSFLNYQFYYTSFKLRDTTIHTAYNYTHSIHNNNFAVFVMGMVTCKQANYFVRQLSASITF